jgi:glycosyltransferase involved in cell wall biosynthesis
MRILMVSPHPTYSPRGTPISVLNRCRALCALGHEIDLVTYGIGTDVVVDGLRWLRAPVPGIRTVKVGPSAAKLPLDLAVFLKSAVRVASRRRSYDVIHTHEEAGIVGALISRTTGMPHVYDMGNDLSVVMRNYGFSPRHPMTRIAVGVETATVRGSHSVIAHFPAIASRVNGIDSGRIPATVVENVPIEAPADRTVVTTLRAQWSPHGMPIALYTGTLENYQGMPALVEAAGLLRARGVALRLVIVGGTAAQQDRLRMLARHHRASEMVAVVGTVSQDQIRSCLQAADILVSPRAGGSNTPLKIFSYMHAGKPLLATRTTAHTQVLDDDSAMLVEPTAEGLADGLSGLLDDPAGAARRAAAAQRIATERYGIPSYVRAVAAAYLPVGGPAASADELTRASQTLQAALGGVANQ